MAAYTPPPWLLEALAVLMPPGELTVSQWADQNRILSRAESSRPGRWDTGRAPYLRAVMDAFCDPEVEEILFVKPTQVGGTEAILNMLGWLICQDPAPVLMVYPQKDLAEHVSVHRIQPMLRSCPELRRRFDMNSSWDDLCFSGGLYVDIVGANSPADLASRPVRYVFLDEEDKFPQRAGKEASPHALAMERQGTYPHNKKTVRVSTPTFEHGITWQNWQNAHTRMECFVACPFCGAEWTFAFKQLRWPEGADEETARNQAVYCCPECGAVIGEVQRRQMLERCTWKPIDTNGSRRRLAFRLNAFYSPTKRMGEIAAEFLRSRQRPEDLQNFINSWLAEPFKEVESHLDAAWLLENRQSAYQRLEVPGEAVMLTGGVDVQKKCFYWTIRGWRANMTSFNVAHGQAFSWQEIEAIMNARYFDRQGNAYQVNLCGVDSGDRTDEVYQFCAINAAWAVPMKGASTQMQAWYRLSRINRDGAGNGMLLCLVDTGHYKDTLVARCYREEDNGGWYLHDGCDPEYAEMVTAEEKVIERVRGRLISVWRPKAVGRDNHYLDCEVYAACAADLMGLRRLNAQEPHPQQEGQKPAAAPPVQPEPVAAQQHSFRQRRKRRW